MTVTVPLDLREQADLERAVHDALDGQADDWTVTLTPFLMISGAVLEVRAGDDYVERRLLDKVDARELQLALRRVVQRSTIARDAGRRRRSQ